MRALPGSNEGEGGGIGEGGWGGEERRERRGGGGIGPVAGWFWMRSHLVSGALQLLPHREMYVRHLKAKLGFAPRGGRGGGGVVGVHIRRGDACAASVGYRTPCQPLEVCVLVYTHTHTHTHTHTVCIYGFSIS
jgi:hypothetical protein